MSAAGSAPRHVNGYLVRDHHSTTMDICTALKRGYFSIIRFMIDFGANVNIRDEEGRTPLMLCAFIEDSKFRNGLAHTLLEKSASVGIRDKYGLNALHYACLYDCPHLVELYLRAVDFNLNAGDRMGHSALFYAVNSGSLRVVKLMVDALTKYGVPVDKANKLGVTPLMQAYKTKRFDIAEVLVDEGCADDELCDKEGKSAKEMAEEFKQIFITEQTMGIRKARTALQRAKSAPPRRLRKVLDDEEEEKKPQILPMQKSTNRLRLCKDCDLRNDPVYMFNLSPLDLFVQPLQTHNKETSRPDSASKTWRKELRHLYRHLEVKHTDSFRETITIPRSTSPSTETNTDIMETHGLRIPGSEARFERRGSAMSSKGSMSSVKIKQVERLVANPLVKGRRGSSQSPPHGKAERRPMSRQSNIPIVREP